MARIDRAHHVHALMAKRVVNPATVVRKSDYGSGVYRPHQDNPLNDPPYYCVRKHDGWHVYNRTEHVGHYGTWIEADHAVWEGNQPIDYD
jgi:hypothetical protein